jgi:hypothetical protein
LFRVIRIGSKQLRFYEAKHYSNPELWAAKGASPRVVSQIQRYKEQIEQEHAAVLEEYGKYIEIVSNLFGCDLPKPEDVCPKATLLVFGYDRDQQKGRMQELLLGDGSLAEIQYYFIGNISGVDIGNMWDAVKCG